MQHFRILLAFIAPLLVALWVLPHLSNIASRIGLIDYPNRRKIHKTPKPLIGGLGMVIGLAISCLLFIPLSNLRGFYAGIIMLAVVGFLDDFNELNHRWKFVIQMLAAVFMIIYSGTILYSFGDILSIGQLRFETYAIPMTILCTVGVVNSINMIDGLDGLAGGVSLVAFVSFAVLALLNNQAELMLLSISFCGALIAFLRYNWYPSKLFMGDAGSLSIGFCLAFLSIELTHDGNSTIPPVAPLLVLAVPIVDTITVMIRRVLKGKNPFRADKGHLHHILLKFGFSKRRTAMIIILLSLCFSSLGIAGAVLTIHEYYLFSVFGIYFIIYFISSFSIRKLFMFKKQLKAKQKTEVVECKGGFERV